MHWNALYVFCRQLFQGQAVGPKGSVCLSPLRATPPQWDPATFFLLSSRVIKTTHSVSQESQQATLLPLCHFPAHWYVKFFHLSLVKVAWYVTLSWYRLFDVIYRNRFCELFLFVLYREITTQLMSVQTTTAMLNSFPPSSTTTTWFWQTMWVLHFSNLEL